MAVESAGWSYTDLADKLWSSKRLRIHRTLLQKKLREHTPMSTRLAEDIIDTLRENGVDAIATWPAQTKSAA